MRTFVFALSAVGLCLNSAQSSARQAEVFSFSGIYVEATAGNPPPLRQAIQQQMANVFQLPANQPSQSLSSVLPVSGTWNACDDYRYAPTYWLPADTERRRAVYLPFVIKIACEFGLPARLLG